MDDGLLTGLILGAAAAAGLLALWQRRRTATMRGRLDALGAEIEILNRDLARARGRAEVADRLLTAMPLPLFLLDDEQTVLLANGAARTLAGKDLTGRAFGSGFRQPELLQAIEEAMESGAPASLELTLPVPVQRAFLVRVEPIRRDAAAANGDDAAAVVLMQDVTAIVRTERMRADFVANVSHELRTPLASLIGFIETLRGPARDDEEARDRFLAIMQEQADRMSRIIADLLSLSRIEMDEHTAPQGPAEIAGVLGKAVDTLTFKARQRDMTVRLDVPGDLPPVAGDADQLTQVFQNLIDNALKYGAKGTEVTVRGERDGARVRVSVSDRGPGIPEEHIPRLTERFYRVDPARSRELGGTGLGLAIVKHIVNRHRGRLTADSREGEGSTFTVSLPAWSAKPPGE